LIARLNLDIRITATPGFYDVGSVFGAEAGEGQAVFEPLEAEDGRYSLG
jgi:hypothetical protein